MTWKAPKQEACEPGCTCGPVKGAATGVGTTRRPVPHPLGGITYRMDPSQTAQWWEDTDPDPVPGGGDRLPPRPIDAYQEASNELHRGKTP